MGVTDGVGVSVAVGVVDGVSPHHAVNPVSNGGMPLQEPERAEP